MTTLSDHFSLEEATTSDSAARLGIDNTPDAATISVMMYTATQMEKVRALLGNIPIHVNSFYRSPDLNAAIGGVPTSQHCKGEAVDFICPQFGDCFAICKVIIAHQELIPFDQLILEHTWVHVSFVNPSSQRRGQVLSLLATGHYASGLTNKNGEPL
jgi:hypothetical protein